MKVSGQGAPQPTEAEQKKTYLDDLLEPNDEEEEEDSDSGEIIDRSASVSRSLRDRSLMIVIPVVGARTEYYDLPSKRPARGTPYEVDEDDDGTSWPTPR